MHRTSELEQKLPELHFIPNEIQAGLHFRLLRSMPCFLSSFQIKFSRVDFATGRIKHESASDVSTFTQSDYVLD
jgi:hypothetical protein